MTDDTQNADHHGRHELPSDEPGLAGLMRPGSSQIVFGALAVLLCLLLGVAIVTQVRQNESGDCWRAHGRPTCSCARFTGSAKPC